MKLNYWALSLLFLTAGFAAAQDTVSHGYIFTAPAVMSLDGSHVGALQFGGGGDLALTKGFTIGGDIAYQFPFRSAGDGVGILDANVGYHFKPKKGKIVPFVTGGYSTMFREGAVHGANVGAGFTWWAADRHGLRIEVRDQIFRGGATLNNVGFRIAWAFR
jgi:hypothetical protein